MNAILSKFVSFTNNGNEIGFTVSVPGGWLVGRFIYKSYNDDSPYYSVVIYKTSRNSWHNGTNVRWVFQIFPKVSFFRNNGPK